MARTTIENTVVAYLDNDDNPDIANPIHSTEVAKSYGFDGPLVGGVTVWGWATDTILAALGEGWLEEGWAEYSFRQPTFPGDTLTVRARLNEGSSEDEIYDFLKSKYGDWIVYKPEFKLYNLLLWLIPYFIFFIGGILIYQKIFKKNEKTY